MKEQLSRFSYAMLKIDNNWTLYKNLSQWKTEQSWKKISHADNTHHFELYKIDLNKPTNRR